MRRAWRDIPDSGVVDKMVTRWSGDALPTISSEIRAYHKLDKTAYENLVPRAAKLRSIAHLCNSYVAGKNKSVKWVDKVVAYRPGPGNTRVPVYETRGRTEDAKLDRLDAIARRANLKAGYLDELHKLLGTNGASAATDIVGWLKSHSHFDAAQPDDIALRLTAESQPDRRFLTPWTDGLGDRLEAVDPAHRSFGTPISSVAQAGFSDTDEDLLTEALMKYAKLVMDGKIKDLHFFLWLEAEDITVARTEWIKSYTSLRPDVGAEIGHSVKYLSESERNRCLLTFSPQGIKGLGEARFLDDRGIFSTRGMMHMHYPDHGAFVYLGGDALLCHEHTTFRFHHSSFMAGAAVKCAGMISIDNGKIKSVVNHSGHYRPGDNALRTMLRNLYARHPACFAHDAKARFLGANTEESISTLKP
jgi:hypothetical protein